jgi:major vault protein
LFNYKTKEQRVIFGPDMVMLEPNEEISVFKLSGGVPKVEGAIKNLAIELGPATL